MTTLPPLRFSEVNDPLGDAFAHYSSRVKPRTGWKTKATPFWQLVWLFLLHAWDCYRATGILVSDDRKPLPFPGQAMAVSRVAVETLGHVLFLMERPERVLLFWRDSYRDRRRAMDKVQTLFFAGDPEWREWTRVEQEKVTELGKDLGITTDEASDVLNKIRPWPSADALRPNTKGAMKSDDGGHPYLTGDRLAVWDAVLDMWYAEQSRCAHARAMGVQMAHRIRVADRDELGQLRTDPVLAAATAIAAILAELEAVSPWAARAPTSLRVAWEVLANASTPARRVYDLRYRGLLS